MAEVKIVMDDYGLLYAILPDGSKRAITADIFGNPYYGVVRIGNEPNRAENVEDDEVELQHVGYTDEQLGREK